MDATGFFGAVPAFGTTDDRPAGERDDTDGRDGGESVLFVSQQYPPDTSGHASRIHDMATALADDGWDVSVVAPPASFPPDEFDRSWRFAETTTDDGVTVHRRWAWQPTGADPGFLSRVCYYVLFALHAVVWTTLHCREYDVVVTTTPPISTGLAGFPAAVLGRRWVVDVRDLWIDAAVSLGFVAEGSALERLSRRFQGRVLSTADAVAVTTETLGQRLCEQYGSQLSAKILLVPNGVDTSRFRSRPAGREAADTGPDGGSEGSRSDDRAGSTDKTRPDDRTGPDARARPDSRARPAARGRGSVTGDGPDDRPLSADGDGSVTDRDGTVTDGNGATAGREVVTADEDRSANSAGTGGPYVVIYTGNIGHAQDLDVCVRALTHLSEDVVLRLVGGGDAVDHLEGLAAEVGVRDRVEFVGQVPRDRVPELLEAAHVGVAPLADDPELAYAMPTKVYEYLGCRLPVVVTGRGEVRRFVERSGGGLHADSDPESVAAAVESLVADAGRRAELGRQGYEHVREEYDRDRIARRFSDHLRDLVAGTARERT